MSRCALVVVALALPMRASADAGGQCHVIDVDFTTADDAGNTSAPYHFRPQMVVWLEKADGSYIDTLYITQQTGTYGLGNRPGRYDFNSGPIWPYGRRITTFPVWAHKNGAAYPMLDYQDHNNDNLSHAVNQSSTEHHFCRPLDKSEPGWTVAMADGMTCATMAYTDKGTFNASFGTTGYPPRSDLTRDVSRDSLDVEMYPMFNDFDAVSQATPAYGLATHVLWPIPSMLAAGDYVMFAEVSKEFDYNGAYNNTTYPSPANIPYGNYGVAYRGQPSVIYQVPFTIGAIETSGMTDTYAGYGDPDGSDGVIRPVDSTITTDVPGSGGARLALMSDPSGMFRFKVTSRPEFDAAPPGMADEIKATKVTASTATISFVAPGDDGDIGKVRGYDIRFRAGEPLTADNFDASPTPDNVMVVPDEAGQIQSFDLPTNLLPETDYYVGIRGYDDCHNTGPIAVVKFTTTERAVGEVDACFVATAAYGSVMANDVGMLRRFRDAVLRHTVLGELFVETYYTFGPALAGVVDESNLLRTTARQALGPLVRFAGSVKPGQ